MGNTKGHSLIVTQNGEMLPWGTPNFVAGMITPSTISALSGKAFAASLGAN